MADDRPVMPSPSATCWMGFLSSLRNGCSCWLPAAVHPEAHSQSSTPRTAVARARQDAGTELVGLTSGHDGRAAGKAAMQRTTSLVIGGAPLRQQIVRSASSPPPDHHIWSSVRNDILQVVRYLACSASRRCRKGLNILVAAIDSMLQATERVHEWQGPSMLLGGSERILRPTASMSSGSRTAANAAAWGRSMSGHTLPPSYTLCHAAIDNRLWVHRGYACICTTPSARLAAHMLTLGKQPINWIGGI